MSAATVEAHLDGKVMETSTDANGGFHMTGLIPNQRVTVWIVGKNEAFVAEYMEVRMPGEGETADVGVTRLLRGSELAERIAGWVGVFMGRGGRRNVVTAVNPWLPGDRAGIEPGDTVLSIDGRNVEQLGPRATTFLLRGPVGSKTTLSIQNHAGEVRKIELERVAR
ncbi:MAG TPA: PDZ domain-containing protein [Polyangia bacterium]|nr:PDZ domain-containing protein [Polyangia bacterium]